MTHAKDKNLKSIGIDVSKSHLDVYCENTQIYKSFENSQSGIEALISEFEDKDPHRMILEPSGGYERNVLHLLIERGLPVSLVHARSVRHFALAKGLLAKTDKLDSRILAQYGSVLSPQLTLLPSEVRQILFKYVQRRLQYINLINAERNRREKEKDVLIQKDIDDVFSFLEKKKSGIEAEIKMLIKSEELKEEAKILMDVKGVADTTTATILGGLPELGKVGNPQIAKLVGVAPMNRESGSWRGQRAIQGGRATIRKVLYMATIVATVNSTYICPT